MNQKMKTVPNLRFPGFDGEWNHIEIGSIAKTITSGSRDWAQHYADTGSKFIRMTNLPRGGIQLLLDDMKFVELPEDSSEGKRTSLEAHDILISITAELGKIGWVPPDFGIAYINQHTALVRLDLERADARFVAHLLSSEQMNNNINSLNDSGAKAGLNLPTIRTFPLHLPSLPEQQKIADFLTAVDKRIQQLSQKKALLEDYKKGVMQLLFTQALRFRDDHGNEFPDWEEKRLGEVSSVITSGSRDWAQYYSETGSLFVRMTNLPRNGIYLLLDDLKHVSLPKNGHEGARTSLQAHDILISITAELGKIGWVPENLGEAFINQHTALVRPIRDAVDSKFIAYSLANPESNVRINRLNDSGAKSGLNLSTIRAFALLIPSLPEQTKIANFLTALDRKIETVAAQITHTQTFKKGLLQQMFV